MRKTVFTSLFWNASQKFGTTGIQFILQLILARLLLPEDYGVIAIVNVFILFARNFVESGLSTALVQKKDADDLDFSTVFVTNLILSVLLYLILFAISPLAANFFNMPGLTSVIRVLSIVVLFSAVSSVQQAYIQKHMLFKKFFISSLFGVFISGIIGIILAFYGAGVWALVFQQITNQLILTIVLYFQIDWKLSFVFSFNRFKSLFSFGWKVLVSSVVTTFYNDIRTIIIGRFYSASALGFYNRGQQFPKLAVDNIVSSIRTVLFPTFSLHQDNLKTIKSMMKRSISVGVYLVAPMMIGMIAIAENLIVVLLTDTWLEAVPYLQIYCVVHLFKPIFVTNLQSINGIGRSDIYLKMETIKTIVYTIILIVSVPFGVYTIALGSIISSVFSLFIYTYPNKKLIDYGLMEQLKDSIGPLLTSICMGVIVYSLNFISLSRSNTLMIQIIVGLVAYLGLSILFKLDSFYYLFDIVKNLFNKRKQDRVYD